MVKTIIRGRETATGLRLKVRDGELLKFEDIRFQNYFYIEKTIYEENIMTIKNEIKYIAKIEEFGDYIKVYFKDNNDRYKLKSKFELSGITLMEADIQAHKRWLIDCKGEQELNSTEMKWLKYDIETKDDSPLEKDMRGSIIAREPILSIAYEDIDGNKHWIKNENLEDPVSGEVELLRFHMKILQHYDIISGWNSYRFDDTYIKQRNELHQIDNTPWDFINQLDYMELVKKNLFPRLPSYALDNVAKDILKDEKIHVMEKGNGGILNLWKKSFEGDDTLEKYNMKDVELMVKLEKKFGFIKLHMTQCDYVNCFIQETLHNSEIWDIMLLQDYRKNGLVAPTKPNDEEKERRNKYCNVAGAYTFCLNPGVHNNVVVFDFKSFYPTTVDGANICVTTLISKEEAEAKGISYTTIPADVHTIKVGSKSVDTKFEEKYYRTDIRGVLADRMGELIALRDNAKTTKWQYKESDPEKFMKLESEDWNYKTLGCSGYGVVGQKIFRFFVEDVANSITQFCRYIIKECVKIAERNGFIVIQGDTDSIMFKNEKNLITKEELEIEFADYFDEFAKKQNMCSKMFTHKNLKGEGTVQKPHFIIFEYEKDFDRMISIMKKNYADLKVSRDTEGNQIGEPNVSITGLECIKKDTNELARIYQKRLIEEVLYENQDVDKFLTELKGIKNQLINNEMDPKYLVMKKSINKNMDEYGKPMIDSKTGLPKINKNGEMRYAPIPAHVKLAKRLMEEGKDIYTGDQISYVVQETGPIVAITPEEYAKGSDYDREYYWERIITCIMKVLFVTNPEEILKNYTLWRMKKMTEKQAETYINKLKVKLDKEEDL